MIVFIIFTAIELWLKLACLSLLFPFCAQDQLGRVTLLSIILFLVLGLTADGVLPSVSQRTPPPSFSGLSNIPSSFKGYKYMLFKFGPLQMTRKGLSIASTSACLTFTVSLSLLFLPDWLFSM